MGILSWWKGGRGTPSLSKPAEKPDPRPSPSTQKPEEIPGMYGASEVPRPDSTVTVFEFGSVAASTDKVTLAGFCPVSDEIEPCRWEILPASGHDAPQFRVVF